MPGEGLFAAYGVNFYLQDADLIQAVAEFNAVACSRVVMPHQQGKAKTLFIPGFNYGYPAAADDAFEMSAAFIGNAFMNDLHPGFGLESDLVVPPDQVELPAFPGTVDIYRVIAITEINRDNIRPVPVQEGKVKDYSLIQNAVDFVSTGNLFIFSPHGLHPFLRFSLITTGHIGFPGQVFFS